MIMKNLLLFLIFKIYFIICDLHVLYNVLIARHKNAEGVYSLSVLLSVCPSVIPSAFSITKFYFEVF